jgi:5-hydroxyisourate hydrolase
VTQGRPTISTHVLDVAAGSPRPGVTVRLWRLDDEPIAVGEGVTDDDGRIRDLLDTSGLEAGSYRLELLPGPGSFFTRVMVEIRIDDASRSHHVPLLLSPFGITMYRGS